MRGFGGADMGRSCRAAAAASAWPVGRGGAAWRVAVRRGVRGEVLQSGPKPWGQRVGSGVWLQYARSARAPGVHGTCSTLCQSTLEVVIEAGN